MNHNALKSFIERKIELSRLCTSNENYLFAYKFIFYRHVFIDLANNNTTPALINSSSFVQDYTYLSYALWAGVTNQWVLRQKLDDDHLSLWCDIVVCSN